MSTNVVDTIANVTGTATEATAIGVDATKEAAHEVATVSEHLLGHLRDAGHHLTAAWLKGE